ISAGLLPVVVQFPTPIVLAHLVYPDGDLPTPPVGLPDRGRESLAGRGLLLLRYTILQIEHDRVRVERRGLRDHPRVVRRDVQLAPSSHGPRPLCRQYDLGRPST